MARIKPKSLVIQDLAGADEALREIADLARRIGAANSDLNEAVDQAKAAAETLIRPLAARQKEVEAALKAFAEHNKDSFGKKRSKELTYGVIGFRKSTKLKTLKGFTWEKVLNRLKELGEQEGIRTKEEADREKIKAWPAERQAAAGVGLTEEDLFYYEVIETRLPKAG